jgi:exopolyphosphatase/guanosine-5'-triphosphate,3'-diphosphate pyrophosphatase
VVAIDLGSNTLRVVEYDCIHKRATAEFEKIVKTADKLASTGVIDHTAVERVIYAIKEAQQTIDFDGQVVVAVTTEAVRRAKNRNEVIERIAKETGVSFRIIDGEEEARLTLLAVKERLKKLHHGADSFVLVDIGGGSTEIIFSYGSERFSRSFPVGIVTIAQQYGSLKKIQEVLPQEMLSMQMFCAEIFATRGAVDAFVATAGTPTTVAAMKLGQTYATYDASRINGTSLKKEELDLYLNKLLSMPFEEREETVGTGRSDLIAAGILIFKQLYTIVEKDVCIVIDDGLREGVALHRCEVEKSYTGAKEKRS